MGSGLCRLARATRPAKNGFPREGKARLPRLGPISGRGPAGLPPFRGNWRSFQNWSLAFDRAGWFRMVLRILAIRAIKSNERLVPVSFTHCCASTPGLSTWWSSTALQGELVLRLVSRLDAFSGYPFHI